MDRHNKYTRAIRQLPGFFAGFKIKKSTAKKYTLDEAKLKLDETLKFLENECNNFANNVDVINGLVMIGNIPRMLTGLGDEDTIPAGKFAQFQVYLQTIANYLGETNYVELFLKMASIFQGSLKEPKIRLCSLDCLNLLLDSFRNYTDQCKILARDFGKLGGVETLLNLLTYLSNSVDEFEQKCKEPSMITFQRSLAILHNCIRVCSDNRAVYRRANTVGILSKLRETPLSVHSKVFLVLILSYIVVEKESESLAKSEDSVRMLTYLLNDAVQRDGHYALTTDLNATTAFSALEILDGLNHLGVNDANKAEIVKQGGLHSILRMLQPDFSEEEKNLATKAMWKLAFLDSVKRNDEVQASVDSKKNSFHEL